MQVIKLQQAPSVPLKLDAHALGKFNNIEIVHLNLQPGEKIEKHINPLDVVFYVLDGKAILFTDTERVLITKDDCIKIDKGTNRGIENISILNVKLMVIKFCV